MKLPNQLYIAIGDYDELGHGNIGENLKSLDDALEATIDFIEGGGANFRVLRVDLCLSSNEPETASDVTEIIEHKIHNRCVGRNINVPAMNDTPEWVVIEDV